MAYSPESQKRYNEKSCIFVTLKLHNENDADIISMMNELVEQGLSKQAAIKKLILGNQKGED